MVFIDNNDQKMFTQDKISVNMKNYTFLFEKFNTIFCPRFIHLQSLQIKHQISQDLMS